MITEWETNPRLLKSGDRVTWRHDDGRIYGPVVLRTLAIDPATLYVPGMDESVRAAKSVRDWLEAGWRVVEIDGDEFLPAESGVYRMAFTVETFPAALYVLDDKGNWCVYARKAKLARLPHWVRLAKWS